MKKIKSLFFSLTVIFLCLSGCISQSESFQNPEEKRLRLSNFVGVWTDDDKTQYYRFTPNSLWYYYNADGEIMGNGEVSFDGKIFTLDNVTAESTFKLNAISKDLITNEQGVSLRRTESPSSLVSSKKYEDFFTRWFEDGNLKGNILTISAPDMWAYSDNEGTFIVGGDCYAYAGEEEVLYLYTEKNGDYFARLRITENGLSMEQIIEDRTVNTEYKTEDHSTERHFYFKEKGVSCNYFIGSGATLLRNGGAAFNDAHDYKRMPVSCGIDLASDQLDEAGMRHMEVVVTYDFHRMNLPILSGTRIYNSVRFSQYDYYTGKLFYLDDSTGNEILSSSWQTEIDGAVYSIDCEFSSVWEYPGGDDVIASWRGIYHLTMPEAYDGFVICLRPVYNSYSSQISASISPEEGTLLLEDLGDDIDKAIFCRLEKYDPAFIPPSKDLDLQSSILKEALS